MAKPLCVKGGCEFREKICMSICIEDVLCSSNNLAVAKFV